MAERGAVYLGNRVAAGERLLSRLAERAESHQGDEMELRLLRLFQRQVADQCRFALAGVRPINDGLQQNDQDILWVGVQMLVLGAGNASKALWGAGRDRAKISAQRADLRASLGVADTSPLHPLDMRNTFEHYDERIEDWWKRSANHNHLDRMIGPRAAVGGFEEVEMFRVYDPDVARVYFWGLEFPVQDVVDELDRILPIAVREADKLFGEP